MFFSRFPSSPTIVGNQGLGMLLFFRLGELQRLLGSWYGVSPPSFCQSGQHKRGRSSVEESRSILWHLWIPDFAIVPRRRLDTNPCLNAALSPASPTHVVLLFTSTLSQPIFRRVIFLDWVAAGT
jgi:hypothetical protein